MSKELQLSEEEEEKRNVQKMMCGMTMVDVIDRYGAKGFAPNQISHELVKFIDYWTEKSPRGKKRRWEKEKTFDPKRRLDRWFNNKIEWSKEGGAKYEIESV